MNIALSTTVVGLDQAMAARSSLGRWGELASECVDACALDPRLLPAVQTELLQLLRRSGWRAVELAHPFVQEGSARSASPASHEREECRAAGRQIASSIVRAADHEVRRIVVYPTQLPLTPGNESLAVQFARCELVPWQQLAQQRRALVPHALDGLRTALDSALEVAARLDVVLLLPVPCVWPHQVPSSSEVRQLLLEYAGAPLEQTYFADWAHVASCVARSADGVVATPEAMEPWPGVVRMADAAGLRPGLPLGCGEIAVEVALPAPASETVLTLDAEVTRVEVQTSLRWIAERFEALTIRQQGATDRM